MSELKVKSSRSLDIDRLSDRDNLLWVPDSEPLGLRSLSKFNRKATNMVKAPGTNANLGRRRVRQLLFTDKWVEHLETKR